MIKRTNDVLKEEYYEEILENGMKVYLMPKKDFYKTYAVFATKYGSRDIEFIPHNSNNFFKTPEGIAHFLEHKLFENEDGIDVSNIFAKYGAEANAYTTNEQTAYMFSTTCNFEKNLEILLDFVQTPYFTKEGINKEQGIIRQELLMYLDQPQNVQYFGLLKTLYEKNSIRNEIGGTVDSIMEINEDLLYLCYNTFYHPCNMVLSIVGNFDLEKTINLIKNNQSKKFFDPPFEVIRKKYGEKNEVFQKNSFIDMNVNIPKISIGLKISCENLNNEQFITQAISFELLMDLYFNESSAIYESLMEDGIINNSFEYGVYFDKTYRHIIINLDTNQPETFLQKIEEVFEQIKKDSINEQDFLRIKKLYQSRYIRRFNSVEYLANTLVETYFDGYSLFDEFTTINKMTINDLEKIKKYFIKEYISSFIIFPSDK